MSDSVEGVTGRWTYFTELHAIGDFNAEISTTVYAIDSSEELKLGVGRLFQPKTPLREREAIISTHNLNALGANVGDNVTLYYDIKLILNMVQRLSGEILPTFLTKETTQAEL